MSKPSAPRPPNYEAAAREQGQQNIYGAIVGSQLANPATNTPFASTSFTNPDYTSAMDTWWNQRPIGGSRGDMRAWERGRPDPGMFAGGFTRNVQLSPEIQALYDRASQPLDFSGLQGLGGSADEQRRRVEDALYRRSTEFLDQRRGGREADLLNRGLNMGSTGYNENLREFDRQYGDAADRAILMGGQESSRIFGQDLEQRRQQIAEMLRARSLPFEEYSNVAGFLPPSPGQGNAIPGAPIIDATNAAYNAALQGYGIESGQYGSQLSAAAQLPQLALQYALLQSDRRLKSNIVRVGTHPRGIGVYEYDIGGKRTRGVMADEVEQVLPGAVVTGHDGYKMVNYGML